MAASGGQKDERFRDDSDSALQDNSSNEDVFDSHSDDEETVSMKLLYHFCLSEICACKISTLCCPVATE